MINKKWLLEPEAKKLCNDYGIITGKWRVIKEKEEIDDVLKEINFPIVMKIVSHDVLHKSDIGGVILNIENKEEAINSYYKIRNIAKERNIRFEGILIEEMAPQGIEVIIGAKRDEQFGPVVMFGLGGIFVEVFNDISLRIVPIDKNEALEMISEIKAYPILKGIRGREGCDIESLADLILKVSRIIMDISNIKEVDLNPVIAYKQGYRVVDTRIILS
ncbi:MAG: acetyl-CoA synthetase [Candidatus Methanomethylicota archaeon]|uniref:Acetyl-CoA synthetase n=1 Tax=Thermoproteota archaeon TaxID=2056631 RepID=A0A523BAK4_9CREN|nr:MAG: acetyl-CoA synthetase [Candidatus Verstraetearchaeota archaeon]TDA37948.1 MAG: acetyl-CoA synthetase [Candidatus Verstraetearchaeota archaeon]